MRPSPPGPDLDADLSVILDRAESIPAWVAIWQARTEPDAHARRCASDAIDAADDLLAATHRIRARLVGEVVEADRATAIRVDELLARTRGGPPGRETGDGLLPEGTASTQPGHTHYAPEAAGMRITRGGDGGRAPHEAAP
jgi:hypothetical protein